MIKDTWTKRFFTAIGIPAKQKMEEPVIETVDAKERHNGQKVFFKFMSDGGTLDEQQGRIFHEYLLEKKVPHEFFDGRKVIVNVVKLETKLGFPLPSSLWD